jgi:hypothetical protein
MGWGFTYDQDSQPPMLDRPCSRPLLDPAVPPHRAQLASCSCRGSFTAAALEMEFDIDLDPWRSDGFDLALNAIEQVVNVRGSQAGYRNVQPPLIDQSRTRDLLKSTDQGRIDLLDRP